MSHCSWGGYRAGGVQGRTRRTGARWGPRVCFFFLFFTNISLGRNYLAPPPTNDTHRRERLLTGWWIPYPPPTRQHPRPRATARGVDPLLCHRVQGVSLPLPGTSRAPTDYETTPTPASNCSRGGSSFVIGRRGCHCRFLARLACYDTTTATSSSVGPQRTTARLVSWPR
jgi:hypothetical protein